MKTQTITDPDPENDSETCCKSCGDEYELHEGCEPSKYCDACAQKIVDRLEREIGIAWKALRAVHTRKTIGDEFDARKLVSAALKEITAPEPANA